MERIIIDMDEVIADPMGDMINWYRDNYAREVDFSKMTSGSWVKGFPEEHQKMVMERLRSPGFFRHLPVMPDSIEVLGELNKVYEVFIVSAATEFPHSLKDKLDWLLEHFPFITWRQLVLCGDKRMINGDHMIDDHPRNLIHFPGKKYLYTSPHNTTVTGYQRLHDWKEAASVFL
jgi:5'(3')-deoxyribonucleotidase